jgi:hypothetical protein
MHRSLEHRDFGQLVAVEVVRWEQQEVCDWVAVDPYAAEDKVLVALVDLVWPFLVSQNDYADWLGHSQRYFVSDCKHFHWRNPWWSTAPSPGYSLYSRILTPDEIDEKTRCRNCVY